jgi:hypothetical protein
MGSQLKVAGSLQQIWLKTQVNRWEAEVAQEIRDPTVTKMPRNKQVDRA